MATVTVTAGKFILLRTNLTTGANPYTEVMAEDDGGTDLVQNLCGQIFQFRCYNGKLQYKKSTDTLGDSFGAWTDIVASAVAEGSPAVLINATGLMLVYYVKTDNLLYKASSGDSGATWTIDTAVETA